MIGKDNMDGFYLGRCLVWTFQGFEMLEGGRNCSLAIDTCIVGDWLRNVSSVPNNWRTSNFLMNKQQ